MPRSWRTGGGVTGRGVARASPGTRRRCSAGYLGWNEHLATGRDAGSVAIEHLGEQRHRPVAELVGLLHHGSRDRAGLHTRKRFVVLVEGNDLHLADSSRIADGAEDCRAVVAPQPDQRCHVGVADERLGYVRLCPHLVGVVGPNVDDRDRRTGDRLLDALQPLLRVARVELAHEHRDPTPLGQRLLNQAACLATGRDVVGADVALAPAVGRIAVVGEHDGLAGGVVQHPGLVRRIHRTDGDPIHPLRQQIVDDTLLCRSGAVAEAELDGGAGEFRVRLLRTLSGNRPEIRGVVRHEGESPDGWPVARAPAHDRYCRAHQRCRRFQGHVISLIVLNGHRATRGRWPPLRCDAAPADRPPPRSE